MRALALVTAVTLAMLAIPVAPAAAWSGPTISAKITAAEAPAHACQCVEYVKNRFGLTGSVGSKSTPGYARYMGKYLQDRGFRSIPEPRSGAVVIFQPAFGRSVHQEAGHVGVIASVQSVKGGRDWKISVRGANQAQRVAAGPGVLYVWVREHRCSNVNTIPFAAYSKQNRNVSYWWR